MLIFYDVDTQNDFMDAEGALYIPDAELIKPNLEKLTSYATKNIIPIIGSADKHFGTEEYKERETELKRNGGPFPDHCMDGTWGEKRIEETWLHYYDCQGHPKVDYGTYVPHRLDNKVDRPKLGYKLAYVCNIIFPSHVGYRSRGLYFEKQSYDVFSNPSFEVFLAMADVKEAVVYGVATDYCVKASCLDALKNGFSVNLLMDAIKGVNINSDDSKVAIKEMENAGAKKISFNDFKGILD